MKVSTSLEVVELERIMDYYKKWVKFVFTPKLFMMSTYKEPFYINAMINAINQQQNSRTTTDAIVIKIKIILYFSYK